VQRFRESPDQFTAVLMDLMMPVMGGHQAIAEIRKVRPAIPVILSSGYSAEEASSNLKHDAFTAFIQKPYPPSRLAHLLRSMIERAK
jgi:CheY-like chemotaxis protein